MFDIVLSLTDGQKFHFLMFILVMRETDVEMVLDQCVGTGTLKKTKVYIFQHQSWILQGLRWQSLIDSIYPIIQRTSLIPAVLITIVGRN